VNRWKERLFRVYTLAAVLIVILVAVLIVLVVR